MNFDLTPEQKQFREAVRGFAERHLREGALKRAHSPDHPWDVAKLMVLPQDARLDDRGRLDRDPQEPHRRIRLRADVFTAPAEG